MKLELGYVLIDDMQFGSPSRVAQGVLLIHAEELKAHLMEDPDLQSVSLDIAKPGQSVRIISVKDVIEPRVKVSGNEGIFPGLIAPVHTVGYGETKILKGAAVVTCGKIVGFQEGIIDMSGPGAACSPFSQLHNLVVKCTPVAGLEKHQHEKALRLAGLKAAAYLGRLAKNIPSDQSRLIECPSLPQSFDRWPALPRVGYVLLLQSQGLLHDTYVYGVDIKQSLTTLINPTELMDGAIVSGNCVSACDKNTTYHHLNNPVVEDLLAKQGRELNFVGMIITNENVYLADKERSADWTAKLVAFLGLDGVIISKEGFGNPDTDLMMICHKIEDQGIKTVLITDEYAGRDGKSPSLTDINHSADAVISSGNANMLIHLPPMQKTLGLPSSLGKLSGTFAHSLQADGSLILELQALIGATNELGFNKLSAR